MEHDHHHHGHDHAHHQSKENIKMAIWLNTGFAIIELIGGVYTNSIAILSDALHDLGDSLSLSLSYFMEKKSVQRRDDYFSYGYKRFSLLGALINSLVLFIGSAFIIREAIQRLIHPQTPNARGMLALAVIGIVVNTAAMLRLRKGSSINERVISLHFIEDVLGWIAVLIGSIVMLFAKVPVLDPILSILIAGFILFNIYRNIREAFNIILQGIPKNIDLRKITNKIKEIPGVIGIHDVHTWTMDGRYNVMTLHLVLKKESTLEQAESVKREIRHFAEHENIQHLTIETETEGQACSLEDC